MIRTTLLFSLVIAFVLPISRINGAHLAGSQGVVVIFAKWIPGPEPLSADQFGLPQVDVEMDKRGLTESELRQLKDMGLTGRIRIGRWQVEGVEKRSRVLIVLQHQLKSSVVLWQPKETDVIYFQDKQEWKLLPPKTPLSGRFITLAPDKTDSSVTMCWVEDFEGGRSGGQAVRW